MSLRRQAVSLTILHAADVLQPLLLLPYAGRVLGAHQFGEYAYALSIGQFATTFVEYGFHWTAQRAAGAARDDPKAIASLFAEVQMTKLVLCVLVTLAGLAAAGNVLAIGKPMFLCAMLLAVGGTMFPVWLLIGLERGGQAAVATVAARVLVLAAFLLLVRSPEQVELAVALQSSVPLISGLVCLPFIARVGLSGLRGITPGTIARQLQQGRNGFLYAFVERMATTLPLLLVQHVGGYAAAGQYSVAEKFVSATRPFFRILSDTVLPRVAFHARHDPKAGLRLIRLSLSTLVVGATFSLGLFLVAPLIITRIFGESFAGAIPIVRLLAVVPLLLNVNTCTSNLYMFNYGHERAWSILNLASLTALLAVAFLLLHVLPDAGMAVSIAVVAKEAVVVVVSVGFLLVFGTSGGFGHNGRSILRTARAKAGAALPAVVRRVVLENDRIS